MTNYFRLKIICKKKSNEKNDYNNILSIGEDAVFRLANLNRNVLFILRSMHKHILKTKN